MKIFKYTLVLLAVVILLIIATDPVAAQCAMCKATVKNNDSGSNYAVGLNKGILYLMCIPYLAFSVIGYFWYKNSHGGKGPDLKGFFQKRFGQAAK